MVEADSPLGMNFVNVELTSSSFSIHSSMLENVREACFLSLSSSSSSSDDPLLWVSNARLGASDVKELLGLPAIASHLTRCMCTCSEVIQELGK